MKTWPQLPDYQTWAPTGNALHMMLQIAGKFRLAQAPWLNHSWHATFYVSARGLTSSLIPGKDGSYEVEFDFRAREVRVLNAGGRAASVSLAQPSVADFYGAFREALRFVGAPDDLHPSPNEVPEPTPFARQTEPMTFDAEMAFAWQQALVRVDAVFNRYRTGFLGKSTPSHLFWGALDLAITRFSGRPAPPHPGGFPALPDKVTREAYSHEVSSAGFWPGGMGVDFPAFYAYAYPVPEGYGSAKTRPDAAYFFEDLGEFLLPYEAVRSAPNPEEALLAFLDSTYAAAASLGDWDREALECPRGQPGQPRPV